MGARSSLSGLTATVLALGALVAGPAPSGSAVEQSAGAATAVGANAYGQLGDSTTTSRSVPVDVLVPDVVVAVASGRDTAYALDDDGQVWGWGNNAKGSVGDGTTTHRPTPVVLPLSGVVQVEAGHYHGIALDSAGRVWAWGFGRLGQIGDGGTANRRTPVRVPGLDGQRVVQVAAGRDSSYAVTSDGSVWAWGSNALGEIGDGTSAQRLQPVRVPGLTGVVELGIGRNHVLARTGDGQLWAWGDDRYGQVGDGADGNASQRTPVRVRSSGVVVVDAGAHHSLALTSDGQVLSWGRGYRGQLGSGRTAARSAPLPVTGLPGDVVELGDGRDQSFALTAEGQVWAWGSNAAGQLGDGTTTNQLVPVLTRVPAASVAQGGSQHTVFLRR